MPRLDDFVLEGFCEEMQKQALSPAQIAGWATGTGAALGGLWQGGKAYSKAKQEGASTTEALRSAGKGGLKGALGGAAVGGALGGASYLRKGKGFKVPEAVPFMGGKTVDPGRSLAEFGGHMGHIWTGRGTASQWGAGAKAAREAAGEAEKALGKVRSTASHEMKDPRWFASMRKKVSPEEIKKMRVAKAEKELAGAKARATAMEGAEREGLTSIPGTVMGLVHKPKKTMKAFGEYARTMSPTEKAFAFGMPAAFAGLGAASPEPGQSRLGGALSGAASSVPWMMPWMPKSFAMSMLPGASSVMPQMALGKPLELAGSAAGNAATSGYQQLAGKVQPPEGYDR